MKVIVLRSTVASGTRLNADPKEAIEISDSDAKYLIAKKKVIKAPEPKPRQQKAKKDV